MSRPDLSTPEGRAAYEAERNAIGRRWRVGGVAMVLAAVLWMLIAKGLGHGPRDLVFQASLVLLAAGWALVAVGVFKRGGLPRRNEG